MARRSLRPELNRIRGWVRQGRTDAWIAHQLEVTVQQIQAFKREQGLEPEADLDVGAATVDFDDEIDLRAEDDALIAAELEAAEASGPRKRPRKRKTTARRRLPPNAGVAGAADAAARAARPPRSRRRSTTARRATACGSIRPCRTIRSMPSTGPVTARSRSRSKRIRS
jgi:hypothetical protein